MESIQHIREWTIPFMLMAGQVAPKMSRQRIIEGVIIAVLSGVVSVALMYFFMIPRLDQQMIDFKQFVAIEMDGVKGNVADNKRDIRELRSQVYHHGP